MVQIATPQQDLSSGNTTSSQLAFAIKRALAKLNVATLVEVVAVHPGAGLLVGFVDVLPLVGQVDGGGAVWPHTTIFGVPFFRVSGGANAVICDPVKGDIGFALFSDRDISSVKVSGNQSPPASQRRFDFADALYFGGWSMATQPTSYVQVTQSGITLMLPDGTNIALTPGLCTINATATKINGTLEVTGNTTLDKNLTVTQNFTFGGSFTGTGAAGGGNATLAGSLTATGNVKGGNIDLETHVHTGVTSGSSNTGGPTG